MFQTYNSDQAEHAEQSTHLDWHNSSLSLPTPPLENLFRMSQPHVFKPTPTSGDLSLVLPPKAQTQVSHTYSRWLTDWVVEAESG